MNYSDIQVPFMRKEEIKIKADSFRQKYWDDSIPVNIEKIIEFKIGLDIIPLPNLEKLCNTDAFISSDWESIYVDNDKYMDDRYQNRLRFSLAHEIGHFVLHSNIYNQFKISSIEEFYRFVENMPADQYGYLETQCNKFAGFLLVPRNQLTSELDKLLKNLKAHGDLNFENLDKEILYSYIATPISKIFGVSAEAAEIILNELK